MASYWRMKACPIIEAVIKEHGKEDTPALRKALVAAHPFGERSHHPYKIWCDEINRQLGKRGALGTAKTPKSLPNQKPLF